MGCFINNINNLSIINECRFVIGGVKRLWVSNYSTNLWKSIKLNNLGIISFLENDYLFQEVKFSDANTKFSETYNYSEKKYEQSLDLEIGRYTYEKRDFIDSLIKAKLVFIFEDYNGKYHIMGEKTGVNSNSFTSGTDVFNGKSAYQFKFFLKSDYGLLGLDSSLIKDLTEEDCSILNGELALSSTLIINKYANCLVGNLPGFIEP